MPGCLGAILPCADPGIGRLPKESAGSFAQGRPMEKHHTGPVIHRLQGARGAVRGRHDTPREDLAGPHSSEKPGPS